MALAHPSRERPTVKKGDSRKMTRRGMLQTGAGLALGGALGAEVASAGPKSGPSVYEALGLKHVINATCAPS
jgi:hypothetical protein